MPGTLAAWTRTEFSHEGKTRPVYRRGRGPGVLVMHEVPGIHPEVIRFGDEVVEAGFCVFMPELFGVSEKPASIPSALGQLARACISREFHMLRSRGSSPICGWLRALAREMHSEIGGRGIGALGMCLTGNFALALMMEPALLAPVLSQPSLPLPIGRERRAGLHISDEELAVLKRRVAGGCRVLGLRFTRDPSSPPERFKHLRRELGDGFEGIEIPSDSVVDSASPTGPHSVLTLDFRDVEGHPTVAARDRVLSFFAEQLR